MRTHPALQAIFTLLRGSAVGIVATAADMAVLALFVELLHWTPARANVPALLAGAVIQFLGCRHLVFRASGGSIPKQVLAFAVTEAGTLTLNGIVFHLLVSFSPLPYALVRMIGTFLVFIGFSYPMWGRIFRPAAGPVASGS